MWQWVVVKWKQHCAKLPSCSYSSVSLQYVLYACCIRPEWAFTNLEVNLQHLPNSKLWPRVGRRTMLNTEPTVAQKSHETCATIQSFPSCLNLKWGHISTKADGHTRRNEAETAKPLIVLHRVRGTSHKCCFKSIQIRVNSSKDTSLPKLINTISILLISKLMLVSKYFCNVRGIKLCLCRGHEKMEWISACLKCFLLSWASRWTCGFDISLQQEKDNTL